MEPKTCDKFESVDLTGVDEEVTSQDRKDFLEDEMIAHGMCS